MAVGFSVIDVQGIGFLGDVGHEEVIITIVVKIAGSHSHARFGLPVGAIGGSRKEAPFLKGSVALIDPELIGGSIVRHIDVDPAVRIQVGTNHT